MEKIQNIDKLEKYLKKKKKTIKIKSIKKGFYRLDWHIIIICQWAICQMGNDNYNT